MSTEEDSMDLQEELRKLEIENTILPPINIKLTDENLPVSLNPFYYHAKLATRSIEKQSTIDIFGPKCSCEINLPASNYGRRRSSSTGSYLTFNRPISDKYERYSSQIEKSIIHQTKFKKNNIYNSSGRRKYILKDPILKRIQNCIHVKQNLISTSKSLIKSSLEGSLNNADKYSNVLEKRDEIGLHISDCPNLDNLRLEDENPLLSDGKDLQLHKTTGEQTGNVKYSSNEYLDFRNLIEDSETLTNQCIFINEIGNSNNNFDRKNSKFNNFTTIQNRSKNAILSNKLQILKDDSNYNGEINEHNDNFRNDNNSVVVGGGGLINSNFQQQSSTGTSCSQQARINPTSNCDVTIDELASYFETFVHIPKKMSEMAEMMYI